MKGHVRKRGNKWCFVVDVGRDANGKRIQRWFSGYNTKREAERAMAEKLREINTGTYVEPTKQSFEEFLRNWLEDKRMHIRIGSYRAYARLLELHIIPTLGHIALEDLRPMHLQSAYRAWQSGDHPLSPATIRMAHVLIHDALDRAYKWGMVARNVADIVEAPRVERKRMQIWTPEHVRSFLEAAQDMDSRYYTGFVLAIYTGMRKGEILALRWSDIDWDQAVLHVNQTLQWHRGQPIFQEPKTEHGRRSVALAADVLRVLKRHRSMQARERLMYGEMYQDYDLVIARVDGRPLYPTSFDDAWRRALSNANVPKIRFHDLRHTHASLMLAQGVHPKIVSERLGHSKISITIDTYSHIIPGLQHQAADDFARLIRQQKQAD